MYSEQDSIFSQICQYGNLMALGKMEEAGLVLSQIHRKLESLSRSQYNAGVSSTKDDWNDL